MEQTKLDSGDNNIQLDSDNQISKALSKLINPQVELADEKTTKNAITPQTIDDNETKLKERIAQCRNIIESLKVELNEEKSKLETRNLNGPDYVVSVEKPILTDYGSSSHLLNMDVTYNSDKYSDCVESKLDYDENLIEYEKQLQRYQNTLNMAQIEKKNAIRKQMMAKAYRLKLLEVENQCNIELLRVKQSLQCLEPLKLIANKWRNNSDDMYDINSYELIPRYPELNANSSCDMNICKNVIDIVKDPENDEVTKDNCISSS